MAPIMACLLPQLAYGEVHCCPTPPYQAEGQDVRSHRAHVQGEVVFARKSHKTCKCDAVSKLHF